MPDKINVSFQCDQEFSRKLDEAARTRGQSKASLIRFAVIRLLAEMKEKGEKETGN